MWYVNRYRPWYPLLLLALLLPLEPARGEARILLRAEARVSGHQIRLGDIADLEGSHPGTDALSAVVLGLSPSGDIDRFITAADVRRALVKSSVPDGPAIPIQGADRVRVRALTVPLNPEWIADSIRLALARDFPAPKFQLRTLKVTVPGRVLVPASGTAFQPDFEHQHGKPDNMLTIGLFREGKKYRSIPVRVEMKWEGRAPVARRDLPAGSLLQDQDIEWNRQEHEGFPLDLALDPKPLAGMKLRLPVAAGELIRNSALLPEQLIAKGDLVEVTVRGKGFHVQTTALADQPGVSGQKIRLIQAGTKKNMIGRVVGRQKVEILL